MFNTKQSFWSEIRNDYIDESDVKNGFAEMVIDAYKTDDDNEQGESIAKILAIKTDNGVRTKVVYIDNIARIDNYAQEIITEGINIMKNFEFPDNEPANKFK